MGRARDTDNPYIRPRSVLSQVGNAAAQWAAAQVLRQSARPQAAQIPQSIPGSFAATGPGKLEPLVKGNQNMGLDLGTIWGGVVDLGGQYINARYGSRAPQVMQPTMTTQGPRGGILNTTPVDLPGWGDVVDFLTPEQQSQLPVPQGGVTITGNCPPPSYCVDGKTGKVTIKQKRRRRRRLATSSDIRDLSSLKSVLSPADLKTWIATHPS
ncbi:MAG: hypothetical protein [Circular genetic element sp.]|nr:MAG: hypothetical protein [Circular genetic element sp.]